MKNKTGKPAQSFRELERVYQMDRLLRNQRMVTKQQFLDTLEVSPATFKRDLAFLRDRLQYPVIYDDAVNAYRFDDTVQDRERYQLPGLWFSSAELLALLTMNVMLEELQPGLLGPVLKPMLGRIRKLLGTSDHSTDEILKRIRIVPMAARSVEPTQFPILTSALLQRKRLRMHYYSKGRGETSERQVSPQRLVRYRDNWYLDAYCHKRQELLVFSVDSIEKAAITDQPTKDFTEAQLDAKVKRGYGIFSGGHTHEAVLLFNAFRARWVSREQWHPEQLGTPQLDGSYLLKFPYSASPELVMDILKFGADVKVLAPPELQDQVQQELRRATSQYEPA